MPGWTEDFVNYDESHHGRTVEMYEELPEVSALLGANGNPLPRCKERIGFAHPKTASRFLSD